METETQAVKIGANYGRFLAAVSAVMLLLPLPVFAAISIQNNSWDISETSTLPTEGFSLTRTSGQTFELGTPFSGSDTGTIVFTNTILTSANTVETPEYFKGTFAGFLEAFSFENMALELKVNVAKGDTGQILLIDNTMFSSSFDTTSTFLEDGETSSLVTITLTFTNLNESANWTRSSTSTIAFGPGEPD